MKRLPCCIAWPTAGDDLGKLKLNMCWYMIKKPLAGIELWVHFRPTRQTASMGVSLECKTQKAYLYESKINNQITVHLEGILTPSFLHADNIDA
jgi:hypothetical protein